MKIPKLALTALLTSAPIMLGCASVSDDGAGGAAGAGGTAGSGGAALTCAPSTASCTNGQIDPIVRDDASCLVADPPELPEACEGTERLVRPPSCTPTGNAIGYRFTSMEIVDDCDVGYDLDGCDGNSCAPGEDAPGEGSGGVDNALAGLAGLATDLGSNLSAVNQGFYDELCEENTIIRFVVDANADQNCANITTFIDDEPEGTIIVNLSDTGCLSGELNNIPFTISGTLRSLDNTVARITLSEKGFANGIVGVTIDQATATSLAVRLIGVVGSALVARFLDINADLEGNPLVACNALSVTLRVGGVAEGPAADP